MTDRTYTETEVQAPERVWLQHDTSGHREALAEYGERPVDEVAQAFVEYVRADVAQALVVEALREAAARLEMVADEYDKANAMADDWEHTVKTATAQTAKELRRQAAAIREQKGDV